MSDATPIGWVLYDDSCGFCRSWIPFWAATLRRRGIEIARLQEPWVSARLGLDRAELLHDLRLLLSSGDQIVGANVYRFAMKRIWWAYPLYLVSVTPLCRHVFDTCYRSFADNRHRFSMSCGFPNA